jgi:transposase
MRSAGKIILVMDNLNAHSIASLNNKPGIHYTPKHGSWLNMAEIELNVINNHGL